MRQFGVALIVSMALTGCGAPIFHTPNERFAPPSRETLEQLNPYFEEWLMLPAEQTKLQRQEVASKLDEVWRIDIGGWETKDGKAITVVVVRLDGWADWERGYIYFSEENTELANKPGWQLHKIDEHSYTYNHNLN